MVPLSQAKTLGGVGSLLILLAIVPGSGWLLGIAGFVLVLIAVKYVADLLGDPSIFNNMVISVVAGVVGVAVAAVFVLASLFTFIGFHMEGPDLLPNRTPGTIPSGDIIALILAIVGGLVIAWMALVVYAYFLRKSYSVIGAKLKVGMFGTTALLYLIGAITMIVAVWFIILFAAEVLQIVSFFSMPDRLPQPSTA